MPKFLVGCHHNEEEISWHLKKSIRYWPVQMNGNKFATGQIPENPVEVVKGRILAGWAQKSPEPWIQRPYWSVELEVLTNSSLSIPQWHDQL